MCRYKTNLSKNYLKEICHQFCQLEKKVFKRTILKRQSRSCVNQEFIGYNITNQKFIANQKGRQSIRMTEVASIPHSNLQLKKYKYINTNTQIQIHKYKNTNIKIQIQKHKYKNTNTKTQIQKHKYKYNTGGKEDDLPISQSPTKSHFHLLSAVLCYLLLFRVSPHTNGG